MSDTWPRRRTKNAPVPLHVADGTECVDPPPHLCGVVVLPATGRASRFRWGHHPMRRSAPSARSVHAPRTLFVVAFP